MRRESDLTSNLEAINELIRNLAVDSLQDILGGIDDALVLDGGYGKLTSAVWSCGASGLLDEADWLSTGEERHFDGVIDL